MAKTKIISKRSLLNDRPAKKYICGTDGLDSLSWKEETLCENTLYTAYVDGVGWITVLDRMTGFSWGRDIESGFKDMDGRFWLASGNFDIRRHNGLTITQAIDEIKVNANICVGYPTMEFRK